MKVRPLYDALNEAEVRFTAGLGAVSFTDAERLRVEDTPAGFDSALIGPGYLVRAETDSGEWCGGVGEDKGLSPAMDARGGKHRRMRYSSTSWAGT